MTVTVTPPSEMPPAIPQHVVPWQQYAAGWKLFGTGGTYKDLISKLRRIYNLSSISST